MTKMVLLAKNGASRQDLPGIKIRQELCYWSILITLTGIVLAVKIRQGFGARSQTDAMTQDP